MFSLRPSRGVGVCEQVAIFLYIVRQDASNHNTQERFQHLGETISHYFHTVFTVTVAMSMVWVKPWPKIGVHRYIRRNPKYYPFFKVTTVYKNMEIYLLLLMLLTVQKFNDFARNVLEQSMGHTSKQIPYQQDLWTDSLAESSTQHKTYLLFVILICVLRLR